MLPSWEVTEWVEKNPHFVSHTVSGHKSGCTHHRFFLTTFFPKILKKECQNQELPAPKKQLNYFLLSRINICLLEPLRFFSKKL